MDSKEYKVLVSNLIERTRRKRTILCQQLLNSHQQLLLNLNHRQKSGRKLMVLQKSSLPETFLKINIPRFRRVHQRERHYNCTLFPEEQIENENLYYEHFRMDKASFDLLCEKLSRYLPCPVVFVTTPLSIPKQVALCLYKLASGAEYRVVGDKFGVHKTTVHKYFHLVIEAILQLRNEYLYFPKLEEAKTIAVAFQKVTKIPNIIGALGGIHVPIVPPSDGYQNNYMNQNGWPSIVMQAVVDNNHLIRDVSVKFPGSTPNSIVFKESGLYKYSTKMIPTYTSDVDGVQTPFMLIGGSMYPLLPWLMKPYTGTLNPEEESFNSYLSSGQTVVENTFARLKGRWQCLLKRIDVDPGFVPFVILVCSILHNFVEKEKQQFFDSWALDVQNEIEFRQPHDAISSEIILADNSNPKRIRENLKNFLKNKYPPQNSEVQRTNKSEIFL